jgi:hypothetical protein
MMLINQLVATNDLTIFKFVLETLQHLRTTPRVLQENPGSNKTRAFLCFDRQVCVNSAI